MFMRDKSITYPPLTLPLLPLMCTCMTELNTRQATTKARKKTVEYHKYQNLARKEFSGDVIAPQKSYIHKQSMACTIHLLTRLKD